MPQALGNGRFVPCDVEVDGTHLQVTANAQGADKGSGACDNFPQGILLQVCRRVFPPNEYRLISADWKK